jgi:hypothetical protein
MPLANYYCNTALATGLDNGTSEANAWRTLSTALAAMASGAGSARRLYVKYDAAYSQGNQTQAFIGRYNIPVIIEGYQVTPGDGLPFGGYFTLTLSGTNFVLRNLNLASAGNTCSISGGVVERSIFGTAADANYALTLLAGAQARLCYIANQGYSPGGYALYGEAGSLVDSCYVVGASGVYLVNSSVINSILVSYNGAGKNYIQGAVTFPVRISNNHIAYFTDGLELSLNASTSAAIQCSRNVIWSCSGYGIRQTGEVCALDGNAIGSCVSGAYLDSAQAHDPISLTELPWQNLYSSPRSFQLNNNGGGGRLLKLNGFSELPIVRFNWTSFTFDRKQRSLTRSRL